MRSTVGFSCFLADIFTAPLLEINKDYLNAGRSSWPALVVRCGGTGAKKRCSGKQRVKKVVGVAPVCAVNPIILLEKRNVNYILRLELLI
jgi:hypothetical protein